MALLSLLSVLKLTIGSLRKFWNSNVVLIPFNDGIDSENFMKTSALLVPALCCISLSLCLSSCSSDKVTVEQLQSEISNLKAENQKLREQLASKPAADQSAAVTTSQSTETKSSRQYKEPRFTDIDSSPSKAFIHDLAMLDVYDGTVTEFKPNEPITRGEFVTWLFKANNAILPTDKHFRIDPGSKSVFPDVDKNHPAYPYIQALSKAGFSVGYDDGTFKPDKPVTRQEMIALKVGVDSGKDLGPDDDGHFNEMGLTDKDQVDKRYRNYIYSDTYFRGELGDNSERAFGKIRTLKPSQAVLRHEAAAALWKFGQYDMYHAGKILGDKSWAQKLMKSQS